MSGRENRRIRAERELVYKLQDEEEEDKSARDEKKNAVIGGEMDCGRGEGREEGGGKKRCAQLSSANRLSPSSVSPAISLNRMTNSVWWITALIVSSRSLDTLCTSLSCLHQTKENRGEGRGQPRESRKKGREERTTHSILSVSSLDSDASRACLDMARDDAISRSRCCC